CALSASTCRHRPSRTSRDGRCRRVRARGSGLRGARTWLLAMYAPSSEVAFLLFLLHRADLIMVDEPALALRCLRIDGFCDDRFNRVGVGFDSRGQRIISERTESNFPHLDLFIRLGL